LRKENSELRVHLKGALETAVNDSRNMIQGRVAAEFRDLQDAYGSKFSDLAASVKNGVDGVAGPKGDRGDLLIISNDAELKQAVLDLRRKMLYQHAAYIAVIVKHIEHEKKSDSFVHQHYAKLLEYILGEIERLQAQ
jgi:hypothetical protein